ncbi:MAG: Methionyl-tRNA formyltransferase [Clostridia bacterium]|jgi:methionyl-tRNA formyltransferase|nr:Methionyl-tRNA formyltransferase [Clostridia bacterium]
MVTGLTEMTFLALKVVFFGNNVEVLECLSSVSEVAAVFTRPDDGTNENVNSIKVFSASAGIPVFQPSKKELYGYTDYLKNIGPTLIIVCGYKFIIPREIFSIPKDGTINIHPSMLPLYRGQHVINWAIVNGESETGVTLHFLEETLDTGDIIVQKAVPIHFTDKAKDVHDRIYAEACFLMKQLLQDYKQGKPLQRTVQDSSAATFFKPRKPEDGCIDWNKSSVDIYNLIRAISKPWPGAFSYVGGNKVIIWDAHIEPIISSTPYGKVINAGTGYITVSTRDGQIIITSYEIISADSSIKASVLKKGDFLA